MTVSRSRSCTTHQQDKCTNVNRTLSALIAGWSLSLLPVLAAHAQGAPQTAAVLPSVGLEEVVVTARRKDELLEDVPQTVTPVTAADIQNFNFQTLSDIAQLVPGLEIVAGGNRSLDSNTFRGVSFQPASGTQNTLGFYINDTFVTNNFATTSIFDIGQIELLSGPQGTLRGEPAPSGSLTITTHRPDLEQFGGYVTGTAQTYGQFYGNAAVNLPIIRGKLAVRLAGLADADVLDGVHSVNSTAHPYSRTDAGRVSVRFEPTDAIESNLMYEKFYWQQAQFAQVEGPGAPGGVNPNAPANYNGPAIGATQLRGVETYPLTTWNHSEIITSQIDWHVAGQRVSYVGSYWTYANNNSSTTDTAAQAPGINAADPIPREPFTFNDPSVIQHTRTNELRLASETPLWGLMDYTVGGFYRNTNNQVEVAQLATFFPGSFGSPFAQTPFVYDPKYTLQLQVNAPSQEKEYSGFLNLTFHLPQDTELTVGGRHISYKKEGFTEATLLPNGVFLALPAYIPPPFGLGLPPGLPCAVAGLGQTYPNTCDLPASAALRGNTVALPRTSGYLKDNAWIYNVSLSHKFTPTLLTYIDVGSSWRPPGVSVGINNAANDPTLNSLLHLQPETSTNEELGVKWTFLENRGRLNVAYFHQKFENFIYNGLPITYLSDNGVTTSPTQFAFNSNPDAVVNGVNLDTGFRVTRQWSVDLNATYTNGHLTGSSIPCNPPGGSFPATAPPPYIYLCPSNASTSVAPNFNSALQSEYHVPLPGLSQVDGFVRGLYNYYGSNPHANQFYTAPGYGIVNLFVGARAPDNSWQVALFAKNAFNARPVLISGVGTPPLNTANLATSFGSSGYVGAQIAARQELGVTFTYAFGSR